MAGPFRVSAVLLASTLLSLAIPSRVAHTCDPGPVYFVTIERSDAPECVTITPRRRVSIGPHKSKPDPTRAALLDIDNRCTDTLEFAATECTACGETTRIAAGTTGTFAIENRPQSDAIDYDKHTKQTLRWTLGAKTGSLASDVTVRDDVEACRNAAEIAADTVARGCS